MALLISACSVEAAAAPPLAPAPKLVIANPATTETAIFAGGCFWGVEGVFEQVKGVKSAVSGFAGGKGPASYKQVTSGSTGHAEAVRVTFDPSVVSYGELMQIFFSVITDPTQLNRQGPDVGKHYRNALFPLDDRQARQARAYIRQLDGANIWRKKLVTTIESAPKFYMAEDYHQDFMKKNPRNPYILAHDAPKLRDFRAQFASLAR
ncbi:peptide-methionine (S)-S-oxide reductase MsrA [Sphingomicrobium flavum]|uniref:peptide-methionine (S)-S-oxide reductase MsrA n=1 Tax=Sphingomicrobium flavum TaxID=1229164 RepID=UPI0021AE165B|nr:peptide-methionine (S)-S-oxide reductase MsrA [Sphingomicrobium flavum]